jgi:hypothetical protein
VGATVDVEDALPPSPLATAFGEPNNLPDDVAVNQKGDEGTRSSQSTVLAAANHHQSQPSILPYPTVPSGERCTTNNVQRLDLRLPPRPPNPLQQDDFIYLHHLRNGKQLRDGLMAEPYTKKQHMAAIDDMARRQLGFCYDIPILGPPQLHPMDLGNRSLYGNAQCAAFQCQHGRNDRQGKWVCWNQSCACRREYITTQHSDSAYSLGQPQGPAEG